jgi:starch synthase
MNVLFAAAEGVPFIKTGGLADVIGSLPKELTSGGVNVRVVLPKHRDISDTYKNSIKLKKAFNIELGWRNQYCGLEEAEYDGIHFYFIDNEYYFKRDGLYGYGDDAERYAFFAKAVLESIPYMDFKPDIIHCHDWHTALISVFLKTSYIEKPLYEDIHTLFTIHNLQYQGIFSKEALQDIINIDYKYYTEEYLEYYNQVNCLKGGIVFSDLLSTVSSSYSEEIQTTYYGEGLDGILRKRSSDLYGILNGIDYNEYNPECDKYIYTQYLDEHNKKKLNKLSLQRELELDEREDVPLVAVVSRLAAGKGFDLVSAVFNEMMDMDIQFIVLGTGEKVYEDLFRYAAEKYRRKVSANIKFSNTLAHKFYAASDIFLMPSRFEPCGLSQLIALRYGSVPVVRETGGLKDTVKPYNQYTGEGNGFSFRNYNAHEMLNTLNGAIDLYHNEEVWNNIFHNAINSDFSWRSSSKEYIKLYNKLVLDK